VEKTRILIVEDESLVAEDIRETLEGLGYHVTGIASTGDEALSMTRRNPADLVLMDINLPGSRDGIETTRALQQIRDMPIIYLTAQYDEATLERAKFTGPFGYILKPFEERELHTGIEMALHRHCLESLLKESEQWLSTTLNSIGEGVIATDRRARISFLNPEALNLTGWERSDAMGQDVKDVLKLVDEERWEEMELPEIEALRRQPSAFHLKHCLLSGKDGGSIALELVASVIKTASGQTAGAVWVFRDVSAERELQKALRDSEERFALAMKGANDGLWDWDVQRNQVYYSDRLKEMLGYTGDWRDFNMLDLIHPLDQELFKDSMRSHLKSTTPFLQVEFRARHRDGSFRWLLCRGLAMRDVNNWGFRVAGSQTDITDQKHIDALTGLPSRNLFIDRLQQSIVRARRHDGYRFAVILLDINRFRVINDSLGASAADEILTRVAQRLQTGLRTVDTVVRSSQTLARLRGDEFVLLLDSLREEGDTIRVAERIHSELKRPFRYHDEDFYLTASLGIVTSSIDHERAEDLLRDAATAMHRAKQKEDEDYVVFDEGMHHEALERVKLESELRNAVENGDLQVYYQPIISLATGKVCGFEALSRWTHHEWGPVSPAKFVPVAEEIGLVDAIGSWVLNHSCTQFRHWLDSMPEHDLQFMSVNLSAKQFDQTDLVEQVATTLRKTSLDPKYLKLEVTETAVMNDPVFAISVLRRMKDLGVGLSIDDFGTGYSSLSYLSRFPTETLKVDRAFVYGMLEDDEKLTLVEIILLMARRLKMKVVAEGIESPDEHDKLRELGCDYGQGWLFAKAMPPAEVEKFLRDTL
jgi:diguanylate cyclase (GGDEF)-like protein/PAS domain S-box-containing protein